jgi:hypothetical protein
MKKLNSKLHNVTNDLMRSPSRWLYQSHVEQSPSTHVIKLEFNKDGASAAHVKQISVLSPTKGQVQVVAYDHTES